MHGLGRPGNELMAAAVTYGCFELAGLFASPPQREQNDGSTIDCSGTALGTQAQYRESSSKSARNRWLAMNWQGKFRNCAGVTVLFVL